LRTFDTIERNDQALSPRSFEQLIGNSPALEEAFEHVKRVAPTDSTVLIQGETGTGKELIARAIHNISSRCGRPFIKLNCAAIPLDLLESELFGHEKGAFTGAIDQKLGDSATLAGVSPKPSLRATAGLPLRETSQPSGSWKQPNRAKSVTEDPNGAT
jgi:transcriptional regulator with GAF, ATPase, and Fis domain